MFNLFMNVVIMPRTHKQEVDYSAARQPVSDNC